MWAYTRNSRLNIVFTTSLKFGGNGAPKIGKTEVNRGYERYMI